MDSPISKYQRRPLIGRPQAIGGWRSEQIFSDAERYFNELLATINSAQSSIIMAFYIFRADSVGRKFIDALAQAAARGVHVRLLVDGLGSAESSSFIANELLQVGAEFRIFHPLPWYWRSYGWSLQRGGALQKAYYFALSLNRRDHRKFCVVDNDIAWCGSFNICDDHLRGDAPWRDYGVRLTGYPVVSLVDNFESVWRNREQRLTWRVLRFFRGNTSGRMRRLRNKLLVARIDASKRRIWICNAYFSPSLRVFKAIKRARQRNVDVRLIVAGRSDVRFFPMLSATYYADLLRIGVSIYSYYKGILHAKVILADDECVVGSTNLNHRSYYHDLELDVVLVESATISHMVNLLDEDRQNSIRVVAADVTVWKRLLTVGWLLRMVRYWL